MIKAFCKWYLSTFHNVAKFKQRKPITSTIRYFDLAAPEPQNAWKINCERFQEQITELQKENASLKKEVFLSKVKRGDTVKINPSGWSGFGFSNNPTVDVGVVNDIYEGDGSTLMGVRIGDVVKVCDWSNITPLKTI